MSQREEDDPGIPSRGDRDTTVIARTVARVTFPIILLTAFALLLQGHNRPGGGFIAGVLTAAGVGLIYIIFGLDYIEVEVLHNRPALLYGGAGLSRDFGVVFALGLALATGGGLVAMALGYPFLSQAVVFLEHLPYYGEIELASAFVFDLGVYLVVVGAVLTILAVVGGE